MKWHSGYGNRHGDVCHNKHPLIYCYSEMTVLWGVSLLCTLTFFLSSSVVDQNIWFGPSLFSYESILRLDFTVLNISYSYPQTFLVLRNERKRVIENCGIRSTPELDLNKPTRISTRKGNDVRRAISEYGLSESFVSHLFNQVKGKERRNWILSTLPSLQIKPIYWWARGVEK